jgi:hypothetical protein
VKFLGIASMKESFLMLPPAVTGQLFEASIAAINQQKKAGKIKELYYIPVWDRAVAISEAATAEEAYKNYSAMPIASFMTGEFYPLVDGIEAMNAMLETIKKMAAAMPAAPI